MGVVTSLSFETASDNGSVYEDPTWEDVDKALRRMDGEEWISLMLETEHSTLNLEGGFDGQFLMGWSKGALTSGNACDHHVALNPAAEQLDELEVIEIGGLTGEVEARTAVGAALVATAVRHFFETGDRAPGVVWEALR